MGDSSGYTKNLVHNYNYLFRKFIRQVHTSLGVMIIFFHLHHHAQPFNRRTDAGKLLHSMELCSLIILLLMNWSAVFFTSQQCSASSTDLTCLGYVMLSWTLICLNVVYIVGAVKLTLSEVNKSKNISTRMGKALSHVRSRLPSTLHLTRNSTSSMDTSNIEDIYSNRSRPSATGLKFGIHNFDQGNKNVVVNPLAEGAEIELGMIGRRSGSRSERRRFMLNATKQVEEEKMNDTNNNQYPTNFAKEGR